MSRTVLLILSIYIVALGVLDFYQPEPQTSDIRRSYEICTPFTVSAAEARQVCFRNTGTPCNRIPTPQVPYCPFP